MAATAERLLTAEEFQLLPDAENDAQMELIDGRVCMTPPPAWLHGRFEARLARLLSDFVNQNKLGDVATNTGFVLKRDPDTVLAPDICFVEQARIPADHRSTVYLDGGPTLAVEIVSPGNRAGALLGKVGEYLDADSQRVWVVYPRESRVAVYYTGGEVRTFHRDDSLSSADAGFAVEGFELRLAELFDAR